MIDRPFLLRVVERTKYLEPGHPLKQWARGETIVEQDEYELYQWPARSVESFLRLAAEVDSDPYVRAVEIALKVMSRSHGSPFPAGFTVQDVLIATSEAAASANDPLLEILVANQARTVAHDLSGTAASEFDMLCWQLGARLTDPDLLYLTFYHSELRQYWNGFPRAYALSRRAVPPAKDLLRHLGDLDVETFVVLRSLLWINADLEMLIADVGTTAERRAQIQRCLEVGMEIGGLLEMLLATPEQECDHETYGVDLEDLWKICLDLAMTFFFLEQYRSGYEYFRLAFKLTATGESEDIIDFVGSMISDLGLIDVTA